MSLKHVGILLSNELWHGPKNVILIWAIVMPLIISFVFSLIFGTLFSETPKLGLVDEDNSQLVIMSEQLSSVITKEYNNVTEIKQAVENGAVDVGMIIPANFDNLVIQGKEIEIKTFIWGESLAKNRTILGATIINLVRELVGQEAPVTIEPITLGDEVNIPWNDRLLPLIVLMAMFLGGLFLPATSLINEKEKKTLEALVVTPVSIGDVFIAKGLVGIILSLVMGIIILIINQAFGAEPALLIMVLALGAVMAAEIGLLCGAVLKNITTLFAVWKSGGILLFGPAIIYMFPQIPQWIAKIFPTYYILQPIITISQGGGDWASIATSVFVLIGLDVILIGVIMITLKKMRQFAV
ncbi:MAG: ABC transporter permease [Dehalococcoidales bacterium]|nr:ABC transporter permease [Dehalococcoidales bacterium]